MEVIDHDPIIKIFDSHHHEAQEVYLDGLPAEVLLKIFTFLDIKDLYRCNKVSKRIRSIGLDESLWQKINLNLNQKIPSTFIKDILSKGCKYLSLQHAQLEGKLNLKHHSQLKVRRFRTIFFIFILVSSPRKEPTSKRIDIMDKYIFRDRWQHGCQPVWFRFYKKR
jgi:hypothetical protein